MKNKKSAPKPAAPAAVKTEVQIAAEKVVKKAPAAPKPVGKSAVPARASKAAPVTEAKPAKVAKESKVAKPEKKPKLKVVRDSFTMPHDEYQKIAELKALCLEQGLHVKKSELLRAGLKSLSALSADQIKSVLGGLTKIKTGRPNKH